MYAVIEEVIGKTGKYCISEASNPWAKGQAGDVLAQNQNESLGSVIQLTFSDYRNGSITLAGSFTAENLAHLESELNKALTFSERPGLWFTQLVKTQDVYIHSESFDNDKRTIDGETV